MRFAMYVDPGYGALILQAIIAGFAGAAFTARKKLASLLRRLAGKKDRDTTPE